MVTVARETSEKAVETISALLAASGISSRASKDDGQWTIEVPFLESHLAIRAIRDHSRESAFRAANRPAQWSHAGIVFALLIIVAHGITLWQGHDSVIRRGGISGYLLRRGEFHRCVTALFIHADVQHLAGNAVALAVLGSGVAAGTGPGVGALLILAAGAVGNTLNGVTHNTYRLSIGASTAVFAAVGILAARRFVEHRAAAAPRLRSWAPLAAALAFLSFLGTGPRTDLSAHLFGLLAGLALGWLHTLTHRNSRLIQLLAGSIAVAASAAAMLMVLRH
ncbi:rhomboid family intramembrane serine protease [Candidatus Fermentibacteria bacterium]|nr:rhomboid family intramembrane serine protease [Candidatus Fermentibacteria bacterium]